MDSIKCDLCGLWNEAEEKACRRCGVIFPGRATSGQQANAGATGASARYFSDPTAGPRVAPPTNFPYPIKNPPGLPAHGSPTPPQFLRASSSSS